MPPPTCGLSLNKERFMIVAIEIWGASIAASWIPSIDPGWLQVLFGILLILAAIGCWSTNAFMLPGNWMILALAAIFAFFFPPAEYGRGFSWATLIVLAVIAALGELIEFGAGSFGAARQGASRRAMLLAMVGAVIGSVAGMMVGVPIPIVGSLVGAVGGAAAGAFGGAYLGEMWKGKEHPERTAVSTGAFIGRLCGTVGKLIAGAVMVAVLVVMTFMPVEWGAGEGESAGGGAEETASDSAPGHSPDRARVMICRSLG